MQESACRKLCKPGFLKSHTKAGQRSKKKNHIKPNRSLKLAGAKASGRNHRHSAKQNSGHQWEQLKSRQYNHKPSNQQSDTLAVNRWQIILQLLQYKQIIIGLQSAYRIFWTLQKQHIAFVQGNTTEALTQNVIAPAQSQYSHIETLAKT